MYTHKNYQTKKELIADVKAGKKVTVYQPGGIFPCPQNGEGSVEGPHYPAPHRWYAAVTLVDGVIVKVK